MLFRERIVECTTLGMLHSVEVEQHPELFIGPTLFFEGRRCHDQDSMDQLVTEVLVNLVCIVELAGRHQRAGQLGSQYQSRRFGLLGLHNAHELARLGSRILAFGSHNLSFFLQSITPAILTPQILPNVPVWIEAIVPTLWPTTSPSACLESPVSAMGAATRRWMVRLSRP